MREREREREKVIFKQLITVELKYSDITDRDTLASNATD